MAKKSLVIVESSAKARTINRYLGDRYRIEASSGHIIDLPKNELGVDLTDGFRPTYVMIPGKKKVLNRLKTLADKSDQVYLALDPDREGEAIAWFIAKNLGLPVEKVNRILFYEITRDAVRKAISMPGKIDMKKVNAQQARRILDRLVGYLVSPILWRTFKPGISAGRVQTVALRLICEREMEIDGFVSEEYWTVHAHLMTAGGEPVEAKLAKIRGEDPVIPDQKTAEDIVRAIEGGPFVVADIGRKSRRKNPGPPFITSTMQQEAARRLGFSASRTMSIAQSLYEGIDLGGEKRAGLITYMRTDSVRMASSAVSAARQWIGDHFGPDYLPEKPRVYKSKRRVQDAHEAIRPTSLGRSPESVKRYLNRDQYRLYDLIWKRFLACQMKHAIYDVTVVDIPVGEYLLRVSGSVLRFPGFMALQDAKDGEGGRADGDESLLPDLREGEVLSLDRMEPRQHYTQPPPRYTEGSLIKELESRDIGRPSTYASIVTTLKNRSYIRMEQKRFVPVDLGKAVSEVLVGSFPKIFDVEFTRHMEAALDKVESGGEGWQDVLREFYEPFSKSLEGGEEKSRDILDGIVARMTKPEDLICEKCGKKMVIKWTRSGAFLGCSGYPDCRNILPLNGKKDVEMEETCPRCGRPLRIRDGRYGSFLACTGYPECRYTRRLGSDDAATHKVASGVKCGRCGADMILKNGKFGRFLACSNYPDCKETRPFSIGVPCPNEGCDGELIERRGKGGKVFYGCSNYPKCRFASWNMPRPVECPSCQYNFASATARGGKLMYKCLKCKTVFSGGEVTVDKDRS